MEILSELSLFSGGAEAGPMIRRYFVDCHRADRARAFGGKRLTIMTISKIASLSISVSFEQVLFVR
jgi:hypothetical protein